MPRRRLQHRRRRRRTATRKRGDGRRGDAGRQPARDVRRLPRGLRAGARADARRRRWHGRAEGRAAALLARRRALVAPGLLVTGEAAGSTYAFTGEGIGKAMETGMLAAEAIAAAARRRRRRGARRLRGRARRAEAALRPLYERANRVNDHPWLADLLIWRARRSPRLLRAHERRARGDQQPGQPVAARHPARLFTAAPGAIWHGCDAMCQLLGMNANTPTDVMFSFTGLAHARRRAQGRLRHRLLRGPRAAPVRRPPQRARVAGGRAGARATRSRATTSSPTSARPRRAAWRWRTPIRSCASCGAATGCSRTTAT